MNRTHPALAALGLAGALLVACGESGSSGNEDTGPAASTGAPPADSAAPAEGNGSNAGRQPAESNTGDSDTETMTQQTPEGAVALFVESLEMGDFEGAAAVCDPSSVGYSNIQNMIDSFEKLDQQAVKSEEEGEVANAEQLRNTKDMLYSMLVTPWSDAEYRLISVRDEKARVGFEFANGRTLEVDVVQNDGLWYVFAPKEILDAPMAKQQSPPGQAVPVTPQGAEGSGS